VNLPNRSPEPAAQEMFMKEYQNYLFLCWQGKTTINSSSTNTLHLSVVYIGGDVTKALTDADGPFLTPSIIHTIYSSSSNNQLVLRSFDISTDQTPRRLHVTFLELEKNGSGNDETESYTYKYLYADLKNILEEYTTN
jgi:hypothetical protein